MFSGAAGHVRTYSNKIVIPGDWLFMQNYNYQDVLDLFRTKSDANGKPYFDKEKNYVCAGENALYVGHREYEGLGYDPMTEASLRGKLQEAYNKHFAALINDRNLKSPIPIMTKTKAMASRLIVFRSDGPGYRRIDNKKY